MTDIIGFNGPPRNGKTVAVAALGRWYWLHGYTLLANFPFYDFQRGYPYPLPTRYKLIEPRDLVEMLKRAIAYNGRTPLYSRHVFCGQELQSWLESRLGKDKATLLMGYWVLYSGKMGVSIVYDTQLNSSVDKRLKENASKRYEAEAVPNNVHPQKFRYWELDLEETEKNVRTGKHRTVNAAYYQRYVYPYYNTYKVTAPLGFNKWLETVNL